MNLQVYDINESSMNPSSMIGGSATAPGVPGPEAEIITRTVLDNSYTAPTGPGAAAGLVLKRVYTPGNTPAGTPPSFSGSLFTLPAVNSGPIPFLSFGVVLSPVASYAGPNGTVVYPPNGQATLVCEGVVLAQVATGGTAIVVTNPLTAQTTGVLNLNTTPAAAGVTQAIAMTPLAGSQPATLIYVNAGGY